MCGIVGVYHQSKTLQTSDLGVLKRMTDVIQHRGPDDEGHWQSANRKCGLGFRRLSIIDLSAAGHQPMTSPDSRFTIVFNGEIYNHSILRTDLESRGFKYRSRTDTETILYGFETYGPDFLQKMVGMWAIALWDDVKKELFCARDRIGVKPVYYYHKNGVFIVASEIKSILQHPEVRSELDLSELPNYLCFSMSSEHSSLFKDIHKLPAGHFLIIGSDGELRIRQYWSPLRPDTELSQLSQQETQDHIMVLLRQAVKDRMMSDVPFGVFLSGGIDSSVNVALMSELMTRPVDSFTVGFKELEKYNELEYARLISKRFATNHHEVLIDHNDALPELTNMVWHEDEPNGDPVCIPLYFLSKLTRESGTTVIQVGEGSDEQLVGYPWMLREWKFYNTYWKWFKLLPSFARKAIHASAGAFLKRGGNYLALDYIRRAAQNDELYWGGAVDMTPTHLRVLLSSEHQNLSDFPRDLPRRIHERSRQILPDGQYMQEMAFYELKHRLPELLLMRVDKLGMAHSLEARVPFLDHRLVEFTMTIPEQLKMPDAHSTKQLLKKAVESILPHEIIYRKKQGFAAPVSEWFRGPWNAYARDTILSSRLVTDNVLSAKGVTRILELHEQRKKNMGKTIYSLLNLALWHKKFID